MKYEILGFDSEESVSSVLEVAEANADNEDYSDVSIDVEECDKRLRKIVTIGYEVADKVKTVGCSVCESVFYGTIAKRCKYCEAEYKSDKEITRIAAKKAKIARDKRKSLK